MRIALLTLLMSITFACAPVAAQAVACAPLQTVFDRLSEHFNEVPVAMWRGNKGGRAIMLVNVETGTWTILDIKSDGTACLLATGDGYELLAPLLGEET